MDKGRLEIVQLGDLTVGRAIFEPGWKWSEHVKPIAGTASCQAPYNGYILWDHLKIVLDDGTETDVGPGDAVVVAPGHDA